MALRCLLLAATLAVAAADDRGRAPVDERWSAPEPVLGKGSDVGPFGSDGLWGLFWGPDALILSLRLGSRELLPGPLALGDNYAFVVGRRGELVVAIESRGALWLAAGTPARPPHTVTRMLRPIPHSYTLALAGDGRHGALVWVSAAGLQVRRFSGASLAPAQRLARDVRAVRHLSADEADDGTVIVALLTPDRPAAGVRVVVLRPGHPPASHAVGPPLVPDSSPEVVAGPDGTGVVAYSGAEAAGRHAAWAVPLAAWTPGRPQRLSTAGATAWTDQLDAAGGTAGVSWHETAPAGPVLYAAFGRVGGPLGAPERVSPPDPPLTSPVSASLGIDACTGLPTAAWTVRPAPGRTAILASERGTAPGTAPGC